MTACGGDSLYRTGKRRLIADLLHQRNGERAGADDVCDRFAGDCSEQGTGNDGNLCRAAGRLTGQGHRHFLNELAHAARLKQRREYDKERNKRGGDTQRRTENAFGDHKLVVDQT